MSILLARLDGGVALGEPRAGMGSRAGENPGEGTRGILTSEEWKEVANRSGGSGFLPCMGQLVAHDKRQQLTGLNPCRLLGRLLGPGAVLFIPAPTPAIPAELTLATLALSTSSSS